MAGPVGILVSVWQSDLGRELWIAATDGDVWGAVIAALLIGVIVFAVGLITRRALALGPRRPPVVERIGVDLSVGLVVVAVLWATVRSGGSSAFSPIAVLLVVAFVASASSAARRARRGDDVRQFSWRPRIGDDGSVRRLAGGFLVASALTMALAFVYAATMTPSPRDGVQPVEFLDEAFYSVLGRELSSTGVESIYTPSGFSAIPGFSPQTWYHWGELWLGAASSQLFGLDALDARHYVVLPLLLVASAFLTAAIVRGLTTASGPLTAIFSAAACLFLAPLPLAESHFGSWASGLIFGITTYGLAAVIVLLTIYRLIVRPWESRTLNDDLFDAALLASLIPAHIVIAATTFLGGAAGAMILASRVYPRSRGLRPPPEIASFVVWTGLAVLATVAWGFMTGHGIGTSALSASVAPFNDAWIQAIAAVLVGGLPFLAIALAVPLVSRTRTELLFTAAIAATVVGAIYWGARLGDFTSFHAFYGPLAVFATPAAAVALVLLWRASREYRRPLATLLVALCVIWLDIGVITGVKRLQQFGPKDYPPIPVEILAEIQRLPEGSAIAYACRPQEELAVWNPRLISIDAHTGRHVMPMCFQAEYFPVLTDTPIDEKVMSPLFEQAPQRELYPGADADPSAAATVSWMRRNGVEYIYADALHPNTLVPDARVIAESGAFRLLAVP